jgi:hypothetical protein
VALYPQPWRKRYASEMGALLEDDPPSPRGLLSLLGGALDAHLRPQAGWREALPPLVRVRLSLSGLFGCWIALSVLGMAFRKETEDDGFASAAAHHPLLAIAEGAVLAGALSGALTLALGGLPLVWLAVRQAALRRDRRLALLLASPLLAILGYAALTLLIVRLAPARHDHFAAGFVLSIMLPWLLAGLACASALAYAPRAVLARLSPSPTALRRAARATPALAAAIVLVACGLALYAAALALQAPSLAGVSSGPVGASTGLMLAGEALLAVCVGGPALVCAARARATTL